MTATQRFGALFVVYLAAGSVLLALPVVSVLFSHPWTRAYIVTAAAATTALGIDASGDGLMLKSHDTALDIRRGCDGIDALLILAAAILAFPARWAERLTGIAVATAVIFGLNTARLVTLLFVASIRPDRLEFVHLYVWQVLIGLLALGTFVSWGYLVARRA